MQRNATDLLKLATLFFKRATLKDDMAKRIMLSIIPAVNTPQEMFHTSGFDYKTLKSAALGAKDLVKYGIKAIIVEMGYYGDGLSEHQFSSMAKHDELYQKCNENKFKFKTLVREGKTLELLDVAVKCFNDLALWSQSFGGTAWSKIAKTLYQIEEKNKFWEYIKQESNSANRDAKTDYLSLEVETMKEIVTLMNVFDGLAHNTGNIMPKLINEEIQDIPALTNDDDSEPFGASSYYTQVEKLMDSKELDNPLDVYNYVKDVIESPQNKHLFGDWSKRIKQHPEFKDESEEVKKEKLQRIRTKKSLINTFNFIRKKTDAIVDLKNEIIKHHERTSRKAFLAKIYTELYYLDSEVSSISHLTYKKNYQNIDKLNEFAEKQVKPTVDNLKYKTKKDLDDIVEYNETDFMSDIHKLSQNVIKLEGLIASI